MCVREEASIAVNIPTEPDNYEQPDKHRLDPH